ASFVQADVAAYWSSRDTYDGVVCLYTLFHLPRDEHTSMLATLADQLRSGGPLLMTFGADGGEFVASDWCGAEMAWSSFAPSTYRRLLAEAGFGIVHDGYEGEPTSEEHHWWVLAVNQS
ncbi:MAG: class I SAM-dependent methyltransferase, partial [Bradymonadaceae bacterium]